MRYRRAWSRFYGALERVLIRARKACHVTVPMLARLIGCTPAHYQRMERGRHPFSDDQLDILAIELGLDADELRDLQALDRLCRLSGFPVDPDRAAHLIERLFHMTRPPHWDHSLTPDRLTSLYHESFSSLHPPGSYD